MLHILVVLCLNVFCTCDILICLDLFNDSLPFVLCVQSQPLEEFYRIQGKLLEFDLPGGIPESWPKLLEALNLDDHEEKRSAAA